MADIRCPMCGKKNPSELDVCQFCRARLTPLQDTAPDSASQIPMHDQPGQSENDKGDTKSPDWLSSLRSGDEFSDTGSAQEGELPDWMEELREEPDEIEADASVDFLADESDADDGSSTDWLDRIRKATTASASDELDSLREEQDKSEEPDWRLSVGAEQMEETRDADDLSDWLSQLDQPTDEAAPAPDSSEKDVDEADASSIIPDWMGVPDIQEEQDVPPQIEEVSIPDWLEQSTQADAAEPVQQPVVEDGDLSDWLANLDSEKTPDQQSPDVPAPSEQGDAVDADGDAISKWLEELDQVEASDQTRPSGRKVDDLGAVPETSEPAAQEDAAQEGLLSQIDTVRSSSSPTAAEESEPEIPDWLAGELGESPDQEEDTPAQVPSFKEEAGKDDEQRDEFDWLPAEDLSEVSQDDAELGEPPPAPSEEPESQGEISEWLSLEGIEPQPKSGAGLVSEEAPEDMPDWLQEAVEASKSDLDEIVTGSLSGEKFEGQSFPDESVPDFSPDELDETPAEAEDESISQMIGIAATARAVAEKAQEKEEDDLAWLQELEDAFSDSAEVDGEFSGDEQLLEPTPDGELPDWLSQAQNLEPDEDEDLTPDADVADGELSPADLPSWLEAMRPVAAVDEVEDLEQREGADDIEGAGPLAGLRGILPAEPDITRTGKPPAYSTKLLVTESQQAHMKMLEGLLKVEAEPQPSPAGPLVTSQLVLRSIVAVVLLAAILLPMLFGIPQVSLPVFTPEIFELNQLIANLPGDAPVLVAVDYQPGLSGEMDAVAGVVVDHLMLKGSYLAMVSSTHTGPVQAEHLLYKVNQRGGHQYEASLNYANLGFIPGGSSGIQGFAQSPKQILPLDINSEPAWENPALQSVSSLSDFAMLVIVTENPETAKTWIEQVQPQLGAAPMILVTSAQAEPMVRPYFETQPKQIQGLLSGLIAGAEYQALLGRSGSPGDYWGAYSVGTLAAIGLIVLGLGYYLVSSRLTRTETVDENETKKETP
jgi:hypothetical protein